ncbi:hypothetical protein [Sporosarcina koreensis]|uniref:hypothetical protein n=1 Tax=Sporosarcina koreensis TaxID=334735 RepID=UPI00075C52A6|nr:hypothetical protein [Sporosarcina koreensis]
MTEQLRGKRAYACSDHAKRRAAERLGIAYADAHRQLMNYMQTAVYCGATSNSRIFDHYKSRTRLVLDPDKDVIITVYSLDDIAEYRGFEPQAGVLTDAIKTTIARELRKAHRTFRRSYRQYTLALADLNVEIAELFRNKVRCKHPGTQALIQSQIDVLEDEAKAIRSAMQTQESEFRAVEEEASIYLRTEGEMVS